MVKLTEKQGNAKNKRWIMNFEFPKQIIKQSRSNLYEYNIWSVYRE